MFGKFADKLKKMSFQNVLGMLKSWVSPTDIDEKLNDAFDKLDELAAGSGIRPLITIGRNGRKFLIGLYTETGEGQPPALLMGFHVGSAAELYQHIETFKNGFPNIHPTPILSDSQHTAADNSGNTEPTGTAEDLALGAAIG